MMHTSPPAFGHPLSVNGEGDGGAVRQPPPDLRPKRRLGAPRWIGRYTTCSSRSFSGVTTPFFQPRTA